MIKSAYSEAIDALRRAYENEALQTSFPPSLAAVMKTLSPSAEEPGQFTTYTLEQVMSIITVFKSAILTLRTDAMPSFLTEFAQSRLLIDYERFSGDLSFLCVGINTLPLGLLKRVITSDVGLYLPEKDRNTFASCSLKFFELSKEIRREKRLRSLLEYVVQGKQQQAQDILNICPELLTQRSDVMDYSGRTFHHVSPWEYMLWAVDTRYMGKMMLACIPPGKAGDKIREACLEQYEAMQGGGRDLVTMSRDPLTLSMDELNLCLKEYRADNQEILICYCDVVSNKKQVYYYTNSTICPFEYDASDDHDAFMTLFTSMAIDSAKKSDDAEYAVITEVTSRMLSRKGIHYEQPAAGKSLVRLDGVVNPTEIAFPEISKLFDTYDALLFHNKQFYYVNKENAIVIRMTPDVFSEDIAGFNQLEKDFACLPVNHPRLPKTLKEYELINRLFRQYSAFQPTHHCETRYDFQVIDALKTYLTRYSCWSFGARDTFWINVVGQNQRLAPAHILQQCCDPDKFNYPRYFFQADTLNREGKFFSFITNCWENLFDTRLYHSGLGFNVTLMRADGMVKGSRACCDRRMEESDLSALCELYKTRTEDAKCLKEDLNTLQMAVSPSVPMGGAGGPR